MSSEDLTPGAEPARSDRGMRPGLPLPPGAVLASFDSRLVVTEIASGSARRPSGLEGLFLGKAIEAVDPRAIEDAARRALEGRASTIGCALAGAAGDVVVNLTPHPHRPGFGLALLFDAPSGLAVGGEERDRAEEVELISAAARELARSTHTDEARRTLCEAVQSVCTADAVVLFEPDESAERLVGTASRGFDASDIALPLGESSGAAMAMRTNAPKFLADPGSERGAAARFLREAQIASILWQPVSRGRTVRAILGVGWRARLAELRPRTARLIEFIAVEGAVAIDRGTAFGRLVALARTDPLTGLDNRRAWRAELDRELARAGRERTPLAVALIDLDSFKEFNDSRGHLAGDRMLEEISRLWLTELRATDVLARYGGDEFALALPRCNLDTARQTLERLQGRSSGHGSFSAGLVEWDGEEDLEALIGRADLALYEAKAAGSGMIRPS